MSCLELRQHASRYSWALTNWEIAQRRYPFGHILYDQAQRQAETTGKRLEELCDHCPYAGQEEKPCAN